MANAGIPASASAIQSFQHALKDDTDFIINLDHFAWRVHTSVLTERSEFFKIVCTGDTWKESQDKSITLHDDNPFAFARILQFLYHGEYCYRSNTTRGYELRYVQTVTSIDDLLRSGAKSASYYEKWSEDNSKTIPTLDLEVYDLADKYGLPKLKTLSLKLMVEQSTFRGGNLNVLFSQHWPARTNQDRDLKVALAECIAMDFDDIRGNETEWKCFGRWVREGSELCTMVMDRLTHQDKKD